MIDQIISGIKPLQKKRPGAPSLHLGGNLVSLGSLSNINLVAAEQSPNVLSQENVSQESRFKFKKEDIHFFGLLGAGSSGCVHKVVHSPTNTIMACKIITGVVATNDEERKTRQNIMRELRILRMCRYPCVVSFHGAFLHEQDIFIMMEYMDLGSLETIYQRTGPIPENIVAQVGLRVLEGLTYLYTNHKIVHRDIKPSNILVSSQGMVKIADFGVSKQISGTIANSFTGTQAYLAPERIRGNHCTPVSDVWGVGLTVVEIATAKFAFPPEALNSIMDLVEFINDEPSPSLPPGIFSLEFNSFVNLSLQKDPLDRATPQQLLDSPFLLKARDNPNEIIEWARSISGKNE